MEKSKWSPIKEILFTYLAINKIIYWFNTITAMNQSDLGNVGQAVILRLLNQDLLLIIGVTAFFFLNKLIEQKKSKYSNFWEFIIFYVIGYIGLMGIAFVYNLIMNLIFLPQTFSLGEFVREFISFLPNVTIGYIVVAVVLEIKLYFKKKGKESSVDTISEEKTS